MKKQVRKTVLLFLIAAICLTALTALAEAEIGVTLGADPERLVISVGKTASVKLTLSPATARKAGVTYAISDESVATVDGRGRVKGVAAGECQLVIRSKQDAAASLTIPVSVVVPVKRVTAQATSDAIYVGQSASIAVVYLPQEATLQSSSFTSSNEKVATVDRNGVVTGVSRGRVAITVRSADGNAKTTVKLTVRQQPESIVLEAKSTQLVVGKSMTLKATVLPKNADNKKVVWSSSNESVVTVNKSGRVTAQGVGQAVITATSAENPSISGSITLSQIRLAKTIAFAQKRYDVTLGQSATVSVAVGPADTTNKAVTFKSNRPKIVSVDENGVVTALAPGRATITATTADGSRRSAGTAVHVYVPVTGVHFNQNDIRVGAGSSGHFTATIEPKEATNKTMTWSIDDESVATVSGTTNRVRVSGRQWGRCRLTGTTEDGGFTCSVYVDVGSLHRAVVVSSIDIRDGRPYMVLTNRSDMHITNVSFKLVGTDEFGTPVPMTTRDEDTLYGEYNMGLAPGERTRHGDFTLYRRSSFPNLQTVSIAITGWASDTGYYGHDGLLYYDYKIPEDKLDWQRYESDLYTWTQLQKAGQ